MNYTNKKQVGKGSNYNKAVSVSAQLKVQPSTVLTEIQHMNMFN